MRRIQWPTAAVLMTGIVVLGATLLAGPSLGLNTDDLIGALFGEGALLGLVTASMRGLLKPRDGGAALLLLGVVAATATVASACGGAPREVRQMAEASALGVDRADVLVAERIEHRGTEARAELARRVAAGLVASVADGLAWLDEQLAPERTATRVLRVARAALLAVEDALDAWDAGAGADALLEPAACAVAALEHVADALDALEVPVPDSVVSGARTLARFAAAACPAPELAAVAS